MKLPSGKVEMLIDNNESLSSFGFFFFNVEISHCQQKARSRG